MKKKIFFRISILLTAGLLIFLSSCEKEDSFLNSNDDQEMMDLKAGTKGAQSYIVVFNDDFDAAGELGATKGYAERKEVMNKYLNRFLKGNGVGNDQVGQVYTSVYMGFSARLNEKQADRLKQNDRVKYCVPDKAVILKKPVPPDDDDPPAQTTPWGITRVNGGVSGAGAKAWVIDTGIDLDHPDLNVDVANSATFVDRTTNAEDDNGHGTHCAGIIAAIDNEFGVVGVAAGATVVAVKVLNKRGSGYMTDIIAGVDYVAANASNGDVANMSLGGGIYEPLDDAVVALGAGGIKVSLAAGNESDDADNHSPARAEGLNLYTISAMDVNDNWAYFSNYGTHVDYCAPGYSIYSCYKGGGYATMSGTSMAAPHVAGILLLGNISSDGVVNNDPDGNADPIAVH